LSKTSGAALRQYAAQAEPLVRFLTATRASSPLSRRWLAIVEDVAKNEQNLAGNGFGTFEVFVRDGIPAIVPEKDCVLAAMGAAGRNRRRVLPHAPERSGGARRPALPRDGDDERADALRGDCIVVQPAARRTIPVQPTLDNSRERCRPTRSSSCASTTGRTGASCCSRFRPAAAPRTPPPFLRRIDGLYPLLSPRRELAVPALTLDVLPRFRANPEGEIGGNQIVELADGHRPADVSRLGSRTAPRPRAGTRAIRCG
jgi:hypothetical protein